MAEIQSDATDASVSNEEASGNISVADLEARLMQKYEEPPQEAEQTEEESEPQNNPDESESSPELIDELSGESEAEESDGEEVSSEDEVEDETLEEEEPEAEDSVLSQLGIDTEGLCQEQIKQLEESLSKNSMLKRINKLTAQKKEAQEKLEQAKAESEPKEEIVQADMSSPVADIFDPEELDKQATQIEELLDWSVESLMNEDQYDDDGNEYLAEKDGKKYTREQLKAIRLNAKNALGKDGFIAGQKKFIAQKNQSDSLAAQTFDFFKEGNQESTEFQVYQSIMQDQTMSKWFNQMPNGNYMIGLMIEGEKALKARTNPPPVKKKAAPKAPSASIPTGGAAEKRTGNAQSLLKKKIEAAQEAYYSSGSINDKIKLSELKAQLQ